MESLYSLHKINKVPDNIYYSKTLIPHLLFAARDGKLLGFFNRSKVTPVTLDQIDKIKKFYLTHNLHVNGESVDLDFWFSYYAFTSNREYEPIHLINTNSNFVTRHQDIHTLYLQNIDTLQTFFPKNIHTVQPVTIQSNFVIDIYED